MLQSCVKLEREKAWSQLNLLGPGLENKLTEKEEKTK